MGDIATRFASAWRDFVTDGVASSGNHEAVKFEIRAIAPMIEAAIGNAALGALIDVTKTTRAMLEADLAHGANTVALVYADATDAFNDLSIKTGASGTGAWTHTTILADSIAGASRATLDQAEAAAVTAEAAADAAAASAVAAAAVPLGHVVAFGGGAVEGVVMLAASYSLPSTRYSHAVDGSGYLVLTAIQAAGMIVGFRAKSAARKIGREVTVIAVMGAASFDMNIGPVIGFDVSNTTGADAQGSPASRYITWRPNQVVQVQDGQGTNDATYTVTLVSGVLPAHVAGDVLTMKLMEEAPDASGLTRGLLTCIRGVAVTTFRISPLPSGFIFGGARLIGNVTVGLRQTATIQHFSWQDTTVTQTTQQVSQVTAIGNATSPATPSFGSPIRYERPDAEGLRVRNLPPGMPNLPIMPAAVYGPGHVQLNRSALEAFLIANPTAMTGPVAYVSATGGAPGAGVLNDPTKPFTPQYAAASTAAQLLIAARGSILPLDFRLGQTFGGLPKILVAAERGATRMAIPGENIAVLNYTAVAGYAGMFEATYTVAAAGRAIHRMARRDFLDSHGYPLRFFRCNSLAELAARDEGYFVDTATNNIRIKANGTDVQTIRQWLLAWWLDAAGNSRIYQQGSELMLDGIVLDGVACLGENVGAVRPKLWWNNVHQIMSSDYGVNDFGVGEMTFIGTNSETYAPEKDGFNLNPNGVVVGQSLILLGNIVGRECGDFDGLGPNGTPNKQFVSSHGGNMAMFGSTGEDNYGQQTADTSSDPVQNLSWYVGCLVRDGNGRFPGSSEGFGMYGSAVNPDRTVYIDTCDAPGITHKLALRDGAVGKIFNSPNLLPATVSGGSVAPTAYAPEAP